MFDYEEHTDCLHVKFDRKLSPRNTTLWNIKEVSSKLALLVLSEKLILRQIKRQIKHQDPVLELVFDVISGELPGPFTLGQIQELQSLKIMQVTTENHEYWSDGSVTVCPAKIQGPACRNIFTRDVLMSLKVKPLSQIKPWIVKREKELAFDHSKLVQASASPPKEAREETRQLVARKAELRWTRPKARVALMMLDEEVATFELYCKFQGILNKVTPTNFQALAEQALTLSINTKERLSGCLDILFISVMKGPNFSIAYANLCKVMSPIKVEWTTEDGKIKQTNFRRMLLTKCQHEFEKDKKDDETLDKMKEEIANAESDAQPQLMHKLDMMVTLMRKRSLSNIKFIGELFNLKMLSETIMHECISRLLRSASDEEALECFGILISTAGKDFDKPEAKGRVDTYFKRIGDIVKKSKISLRIKFLLQDVQDLRCNGWVPRHRQECMQLKTIDQIHAEAKMEEQKEKEMIQQHQVAGNYPRGGGGAGGGRDSRRGSKADEWQGSKGADRDRKEASREKFDGTKVAGLSKRKEKGTTQTQVGPMLHPGGWKSKGGTTTSPALDTKKLSRMSGCGPNGKGFGSGVKRSHTREAALETVSQSLPSSSTTGGLDEFLVDQTQVGPMLRPGGWKSKGGTTTSPALDTKKPSRKDKHGPHVRESGLGMEHTHTTAVQAVLLRKQPSAAPPPPKMDESTFRRKTVSIIDELVNNGDFREAVECVKDLHSPDQMGILVNEGINHTMEKKAEFRVATGKLFNKLVQEKVLTQDKFLEGLNEVLEYAEDICIDIPQFWDYLGQVLAPVMSHSTLSLSLLGSVPSNLVSSGRAAKLVAKVLQQCYKELGSSEEAVKSLWMQSRLNWNALGMSDQDLEEFLVDQHLGYLHVEVEQLLSQAQFLAENTSSFTGHKKRRSHAIHIVDPTTNAEVKIKMQDAAAPDERTAAPDEWTVKKEMATEELHFMFFKILTQLTPQNFHVLSQKVLSLNINTKEKLSGCVDMIFSKALEEPHSGVYASLCKVMTPIKVEWTTVDGRTKQTNFRRMLLTKCQHEFEKDKKDDETLDKMKEEIANAESKAKRQELTQELGITMTLMRKRSLGNILFIGELFNLKMLSETIMHECITRLLKSASDEEALECFGKLITTTGKDLDKPEARARIDTYFQRIGDIIKKSKIPARIKFLLQDVQDLRSNGWVPRGKHGSMTASLEEWEGSKGADKDREKLDQIKVVGILSKRNEKGTTQTQLGPMLHPGGWKSKGGTTTSPALDTKKPSRKGKHGPHVRESGLGMEHTHTTAVQAVLLRKQPSAAPPPPKMDESTFRRKTVSIIDELVNNKDFKEAVECVKDLRSPDQMGILVNEGINHTVEKKAEFRVATGKLFNKLVQEKVLTQDKFLEGLNDVLEFAEDICIDIPQFCDYLGQVLAPVMSHSTLSLSLLGSVPPNLVSSGRAAKLVAKVLQQCHKELGSSEEAVKSLWMQSRLNWNALGMSDQDLEEFLVDQKLEYLRAEVEQVPSYLSELQQRLQSDLTNDEIAQWIKGNHREDVAFIKDLAMAAVQASVTGQSVTVLAGSLLSEVS